MAPITFIWTIALLLVGAKAFKQYRREGFAVRDDDLVLSTTAARLRPFVNPALTYFGGPIVENVEVFPIFYASTNAQRFSFNPKATLINQFYAAVVNSEYFDWLTEYSVQTKRIGRGRLAGYYVGYDRPNTALTLNSTTIENFLINLANNGRIRPNPNRYFPIHFPPGYTIFRRGYQSCKVFCAYHGAVNWSGQKIYYSVIPHQGGSCAGGCGSSSNLTENVFALTSHVLVNTVTDPAGSLAPTLADPLAWYDPKNYAEIGRLCNGNGTVIGGDGRTYVVHEQWSNRCGQCIVKYNATACPPILE